MRFYTSAENTRGTVKGIGAHRGQTAHIRTWDLGVRVVARHDADDAFEIYITGGSREPRATRLIGILMRGKSGKPTLKRVKKI